MHRTVLVQVVKIIVKYFFIIHSKAPLALITGYLVRISLVKITSKLPIQNGKNASDTGGLPC